MLRITVERLQDIINRCNDERKKEKKKFEEEIQQLQESLSIAVAKEVQTKEQNKVFQEFLMLGKRSKEKLMKNWKRKGNLVKKKQMELILMLMMSLRKLAMYLYLKLILKK